MTPAKGAAAPLRLPLWVDLRHVPVNKRLPYLKAIEQAGVHDVLLAAGDAHAKRDGLPVVTVHADGQLRCKGRRAGRLTDVHDAQSQARAAKGKGVVVVDGRGWRVIPLENLIADRADRPGTLFAVARSPDEARLFATTLQTGAHGILLIPRTAADIAIARRELDALPPTTSQTTNPANSAKPAKTTSGSHSAGSAKTKTTASAGRLTLRAATLTKVAPGGEADRVCVDTSSLLHDGEGLLVGSTAHSLLFVHAETSDGDLLRARPFRVNAGALHMYAAAPAGRTTYLSELRAGDDVLVAKADGSHRTVKVGRAKVETRPHLMLHWDAPGGPASALVQTAETVRVLGADGKPIAVTSLKQGDRVLVHDDGAAGRHAGRAVAAKAVER